ncbi:DUF6172 family protein [Ghiorsea bivora]|uniref:DUF6172 family protein n=1 Tax=Ghiorsea bivora TaxID=1485545 RepID=UPI00056EFF17|nr:DUF6172 family protein [Ghiorsea bivora]
MKKTFNLTHPKTKYARLIDAVRSDIKRYIKRERKKALPEGFDTWDFDCKFGANADEAKVLDVTELSKAINDAEAQGLASFYIEILAKAGHRPPKPVREEIEDAEHET